jgi:hypothetical protein
MTDDRDESDFPIDFEAFGVSFGDGCLVVPLPAEWKGLTDDEIKERVRLVLFAAGVKEDVPITFATTDTTLILERPPSDDYRPWSTSLH